MLNKKNMAIAMAAATAAAPFATTATIFADVVDNTQAEEIKALKEKVYGVLNAKYTENHNLLVNEGATSASALADTRVYSEVKILVNGTEKATAANYADFVKKFDKEFTDIKNGDKLQVKYESTYGVEKLADGSFVNAEAVEYDENVADLDGNGTLENKELLSDELKTYLDAQVVAGTKDDDSKYAKVPVTNGYITVVEDDAQLDLTKPKFKVVNGYYVDEKGNSVKKFDQKKECLPATITELINLDAVIEGYYPVVEKGDVKVDSNTVAIVKNSAVETKEELKVSDLYEEDADRLTVKGNELIKTIKDVVADEADTTNDGNDDNLKVKVTTMNKAGEEIAKLDTEGATNADAKIKEIADAIAAADVETVKLSVEKSADETDSKKEWNTVYEATITEGRNEKFINIARALDATKGALKVDVLAGMDRYATAVETSKKFTSADTVVLVSGANEKMVDGLAATPLAAKLDAPVLLTKTNEVPQIVIDEIERLEAKKVIIVGGESSISKDVESKLEKTNGLDVERLGGNSRYETSLEVANKMVEDQNNASLENVFVVGGKGVADALSASSIAGQLESPILLTPANELDKDVKNYINKNVKNTDNKADVFVVGGTNSVSATVQNELLGIKVVNADKDNVEVKRLAGDSREETNAAVIDEFVSEAKNIVVAKSANAGLVDALSAGAYAAHTDAHIVLASNELTNSQEDALEDVVTDTTPIRQIGYNVATSVAEFLKDLVK